MANKKLDNLLNDKEKGINNTHGENGALSRLFRLILKKRNIGPERFGQYMADHLRDPRNRVVGNRKKVQSTRGNLGMALYQPRMTWKVFCKGLRFAKIWKIDIAIRAYYTDNTTDVIETSLVLSENRVAAAVDQLLANMKQTPSPQPMSRDHADEDKDGTDK